METEQQVAHTRSGAEVRKALDSFDTEARREAQNAVVDEAFNLGNTLEHSTLLWLERGKLLKALEALYGHIETGDLVRDTSGDSEPGWAMKQVPLVTNLAVAKAAIAAARG